jgi:hypothetical protein
MYKCVGNGDDCETAALPPASAASVASVPPLLNTAESPVRMVWIISVRVFLTNRAIELSDHVFYTPVLVNGQVGVSAGGQIKVSTPCGSS